MLGTQLLASPSVFKWSQNLPPSEMKSLYGSITRSATISFSYFRNIPYLCVLLNGELDLLTASIRRHTGHFCRRRKCRRILPDELLHALRPLPCQPEHVVGHPIIASSTMQVGHGHEVVHQVRRKATFEQCVPPRLDRNVLIGDRAAKRLRIFLCIEMHVLGLRSSQVIDLADVRLRIGEQRGDHTGNIAHCHWRSFALSER